MIKWNCNFNIEDTTVQLGVALVEVVAFTNVNNTATADIIITDESKEIVVKQYTQKFSRSFRNVEEVYAELVKKFVDAVVM